MMIKKKKSFFLSHVFKCLLDSINMRLQNGLKENKYSGAKALELLENTVINTRQLLVGAATNKTHLHYILWGGGKE